METQYIKKNENGTFYHKDKKMTKLHRVDGPACEWTRGVKFWYLNGKLHREDGPAIEWADGGKEWYLNGERHREDGPAIEWAGGDKIWYLNGDPLTEKEFNTKMNLAPIELTIELTIEEIATWLGIAAKRLKVIA